MRSLMRRLGRVATVAVLAALAVSLSPAEYDVVTRRSKDYRRIHSVVAYPLKCPRGIDCRILEIRFAEELAEVGKVRVLGAADLRQLAYDRGLDLALPGALASLIRSLEVDAVVLGGVPGVDPEDRWTFNTVVGSKIIKPSAQTPKQTATITCLALDGRTLFEGSADGNSKRGLQVQQEIVARKFRSILKHVFD